MPATGGILNSTRIRVAVIRDRNIYSVSSHREKPVPLPSPRAHPPPQRDYNKRSLPSARRRRFVLARDFRRSQSSRDVYTSENKKNKVQLRNLMPFAQQRLEKKNKKGKGERVTLTSYSAFGDSMEEPTSPTRSRSHSSSAFDRVFAFQITVKRDTVGDRPNAAGGEGPPSCPNEASANTRRAVKE